MLESPYHFGAGLVLFQPIAGQPSVLYYAATIFQTAGFAAASDATRVSILLGLLKLIITGLAVVVIDKLGRRPLLLGGVSGMVDSSFKTSDPGIFCYWQCSSIPTKVGETVEVGNFDPKIATFWMDFGN